MRETIIFVLIFAVAVLAAIRAVIINKYRNELSQNEGRSAITSLAALKRTHRVAGNALVVTSALQVVCVVALLIAVLYGFLQ
jgi:hypothetical protein